MAQPGAEQHSPKPAPDPTAAASNQNSPGIFSQQYSADEGGMSTEIFCPSCGEEIRGSYLPCFRCPHCSTLIFRDERGIVISYEQTHTCPECGHTFGEMSEEAPTDFRRFCRNFEQKTEGVILQLERFVGRLLA